MFLHGYPLSSYTRHEIEIVDRFYGLVFTKILSPKPVTQIGPT